MRQRSAWILLVGLATIQPVASADLFEPAPAGRFIATCEDLGTLCFADACGGDQIDAAQGCRAQCSHAVVLSVVPTECPLSDGPRIVALRRRG